MNVSKYCINTLKLYQQYCSKKRVGFSIMKNELTQHKSEINSQEIFGAEIQYFRMEPEYWEKAIKQFKETGLRTVTTYVQWATHMVGSPDDDHPAGILDFEGKTDPKLDLMRFIGLVEKYGLNLNFRCGPFCCNEMVHGGYPDFLCMGDPSIMVWDYQNRTTQGYWVGKAEGSQPSYMHPVYLDWCRKWINEVDKIILPHLKSNGGCITMVNLDNEISYIVQDGFLTSDYNPVNVAKGGLYHKFLAQKYVDISNLPYAEKYSSFEDIPAPRNVPDVLDCNIAYYTDWCDFKTWIMCEYIKELKAMHEANGVKDVIFMTNFNPHLPEGVPTRMPEFEKATNGGIVGYDFYRGTFMSYSGYQSMARVLKLMNASVSYTWSAEFMSGTWNKILDSRVSDDHMRFMARSAFSHGCKAIDWFMFHDRDCWNDAPLSSHAQKRPSYKVLKETPGILFSKIKNWDKLEVLGDVSIIYDLSAHQHTYLGDPSPCADNELYIGAPEIDGIKAGISSKEYIGMFRLVEQAGLQADAVDIALSGERLYKHKLAFLAGSPITDPFVEAEISQYITCGNTVVITGKIPSMYVDGTPCKYLGLDNIKVGENVVGNGKLIYIDKFIAQTNSENDSIESIDLVSRLLTEYGDKAHVKVSIPKPTEWVDWAKQGRGHRKYIQPCCLGSAILHKYEDENILFVLNHYPEACKFDLEFNGDFTKLVCLTEDSDHEIVDGKATVDIDRKNCQIYKLI